MTSGLLTLILLLATASAEAGESLDELVAAVAPEGDRAELDFRETRQSPLLSEPLVVTGRMWRNRRGQLVRETVEPRQATYTLTSSMIVIERPGQSPRNHSLAHVPELAVLYHGLSALLGGDADALRERFEHELRHEETGWRLLLRPRDESLAERVTALSLSGEADRLQRFELELADGETIETELSRRP
ncbi:LolA-related protein [Wenzhouxiangella sp. EGI_FJ10409]|uniref:LolA-related protein n=1 Tax=Wenzhouxiangella sp. EGI_FJ10409 TaxID=3243767 RepID=UPI0035D68DF2